MDQEQRNMLAEILESTRENNKILKNMRRNARFASFFRFLRWLIVLGLSIYAYYYIQPYLQKTIEMYNQINSSVNDLNSKTSNGISQFNSLLNSIGIKSSTTPSTTTRR